MFFFVYFFGGLFDLPPPEGLPVVDGHPPALPCPRLPEPLVPVPPPEFQEPLEPLPPLPGITLLF